MAYLGRVVGIGRTETGRPFVVYGLSGRSESSRRRKAVPYRTRVAIEPLGEMTEEQRKQSALLVYDAIKVSNGDPSDDKNYPYAIVSNGRHTDSLDHVLRTYLPLETDGLKKVLQKWGPEPDKYLTPRIMAVNSLCGHHALGSIAENNKPRLMTFFDRDVPLGRALTLSTYSGVTSEPEAPRFRRVREIVRRVPLKGDSPDELSASFFEWMDPRFVVATASAVWIDEEYKWRLASFRNPITENQNQ